MAMSEENKRVRIEKMDDAELIYEFDFETEDQRNDFGLMCSKCRAGIYCGDREQVSYTRSITYYCYSCGAKFRNCGSKN